MVDTSDLEVYPEHPGELRAVIEQRSAGDPIERAQTSSTRGNPWPLSA